jgi:hypothetical protein
LVTQTLLVAARRCFVLSFRAVAQASADWLSLRCRVRDLDRVIA